ncbi:hydrogenase maturation factor hoxX [Mariannaea sp. PMI_226]|nr:hydrogenase maturation factor hoxX [Mariannaea sp. PMI_226]
MGPKVAESMAKILSAEYDYLDIFLWIINETQQIWLLASSLNSLIVSYRSLTFQRGQFFAHSLAKRAGRGSHTCVNLRTSHKPTYQRRDKYDIGFIGPSFKMKILFLCTAHNSLSQRLYLALAESHTITIEYALSSSTMIDATTLYQPDLIICPFLTTRVPRQVHRQFLTLIVHPGPPGDVGPSALDWLLMGDDGSEDDPGELLRTQPLSASGRQYWGVTVLQAIEELDAGPVWAFEQFPVHIDDPQLTKSTLYRGAVTRAAVTAILAAVERIQATLMTIDHSNKPESQPSYKKPGPILSPDLAPSAAYREFSVTDQKPFQGGRTRHRPLLRAAHRDFDISLHMAKEISRRIRCSDSQPGCLSAVLGQSLYLYGGIVEEGRWIHELDAVPGAVVGCRDEAVCIATCDKKVVWITHVRRVKRRQDSTLWPKVPAVTCLLDLQLLSPERIERLSIPQPTKNWSAAVFPTFQEVWVEFDTVSMARRVAYVFFEFYNGAMSSTQCTRLIEAFEFVLSTHTDAKPLSAVVLMGGTSYFSNGIHLNVIETSVDPAHESWENINRIDDVVFYLLHEFPKRNILTVAAIRGNCAAGGVAVAAACDQVIAGADIVLNPAYRALGLYGSEYHTLSYTKRCGEAIAGAILRNMLPFSANDAQRVGLVDHVVADYGVDLNGLIRNHVATLIGSIETTPSFWKAGLDLSLTRLARVRAAELGEMAKDFWSPRAIRYHSRRSDFVRKVKPRATPLRFAIHRRVERGKECLDEEEKDEFDSIQAYEEKTLQIITARTYERLPEDRGVIFPCHYES